MAHGPTNPTTKRIAEPLVAAIGSDHEIGPVHRAPPGPRGPWDGGRDRDNIQPPQRAGGTAISRGTVDACRRGMRLEHVRIPDGAAATAGISSRAPRSMGLYDM